MCLLVSVSVCLFVLTWEQVRLARLLRDQGVRARARAAVRRLRRRLPVVAQLARIMNMCEGWCEESSSWAPPDHTTPSRLRGVT